MLFVEGFCPMLKIPSAGDLDQFRRFGEYRPVLTV